MIRLGKSSANSVEAFGTAEEKRRAKKTGQANNARPV
jgi:hypothetical protein